MHKRALLTGIAGGLLAAVGVFAACSSSTTVVDAGHDGGLDVVTVFETGSQDSFVAPIDTGAPDDAGSRDAAADRHVSHDAASEAHAATDARAACTEVKGACSLVAQNCSSGSECVLLQVTDGSVTTSCMAAQPTETLRKGAACCPASDGTNPCDPGLVCAGGNACATADASPSKGATPAGWGGSRCTPYCCASDAGPVQANCGTANDGGIVGLCDLSFAATTNGLEQYSICTYPSGCEPLRGPECLSGFGCEIGQDGGAGCTVIYNPEGDAAATNGQACVYGNSCADGYVCLGTDASTCQWMCHVANQPPPFDAGLLQNTTGYGGCPSGQDCVGVIGFPTWLGACVDP